MKHRKLTQSERELLSRWKREGLSNYDCAKRLGRHVSTIGRELSRNKTRVSVGKDWQIIYEPLLHKQWQSLVNSVLLTLNNSLKTKRSTPM